MNGPAARWFPKGNVYAALEKPCDKDRVLNRRNQGVLTVAGGGDRDVLLAEALESERNSFNLVRLGAAVAVVVSHSFALLIGEGEGEPLSGATPYTLGQHAVNVFFVLSGVMLSRSWSLNPNLGRFALARLLRIYPALAACGLVVVLLLAPLGTHVALGTYFADRDTLLYPVRVLFAFNRAGLDEVFTSGTLKPGSINGPLWTIKYELAAYALFVIAAAVGLVRRPAFAVAFLLGASLAVIGMDLWEVAQRAPTLPPPGRFLMSFALGIAAYTFRAHIPLGVHCLAAFLALAVAAHGSIFEKPAYVVLTGYGALYFGSFVVPRASAWAGSTDLSYGVYLYAWPVQQLLLFRWPEIGLAAHTAASLAGATALAVLSWRYVERPALALKGAFGSGWLPVTFARTLPPVGGATSARKGQAAGGAGNSQRRPRGARPSA